MTLLLRTKRAMLLVMLGGTSILLMSCQTMGFGATNPPPVDPKTVACNTFKPITWSKQDTLETAKQIVEHNAAWKALCQTAPAPKPSS